MIGIHLPKWHRIRNNIMDSKSKICVSYISISTTPIFENKKPSTQHNHTIPFKANILELGFISAESAVIGLLNGCIGMFMSIITTLFCGAVSRTQINLSDSIVTCVNVMNCGLIPMLGSWKFIRSHNPISQ